MGETLAQVAGLVVLAGFFLMVLHSVYKVAERVPPASDCSPAGVTHELLAVVGILLALAFYRLAESVNIISWVESATAGHSSAAALFVSAGPSLAASLMTFLAVHRLALSRNRGALWQALILLWCGSVGHTYLRPRLTGFVQEPGEVVAMVGVAVLCTLCLLISKRAKNTYGL